MFLNIIISKLSTQYHYSSTMANRVGYAHPQQGGSGAAGLWIILKGRCPGGNALQSGDLGGNPLHGKIPGGVSYPGGESADGNAPAEDVGREVEIHFGGILDNGGVYQAAAEHGRTVHRYAINFRPVWSVRKSSGGASRDAVVGRELTWRGRGKWQKRGRMGMGEKSDGGK